MSYASLTSALRERGVTEKDVKHSLECGGIEAIIAAVRSAQPPESMLRLLSAGHDIEIGPTDGQRTTDRATQVVVYELAQDGTFVQMFTSLNPKIDRLVLKREQVVCFCRESPEWLSKTGLTFFLLKEEEKYIVVYVSVSETGELSMFDDRFEDGYVWRTEFHDRLVSPQL